MQAALPTAGERVFVDCGSGWVADRIGECVGDALERTSLDDTTMEVRVEPGRAAFDTTGWGVLARGAWNRDGRVVIRDVCTSGFDLSVTVADDRPTFTFRRRPPSRTRLAGVALRSRSRLLLRAALLQYPAMWWAGTRGRVPLHASVCALGRSTPLLAGPSGVGKTTLLLGELRAGARAVSDNLCVTDGTTAWGVVEPMRAEGGAGRRMPHGRGEVSLPSRVDSLVPDRLVFLARGDGRGPLLAELPARSAARALVAGTYAAGELRRYWSFAATLAAGTGLGPAHPAIADVAAEMADRLPSAELSLPDRPGPRLSDLLVDRGTPACV
jgi:hypothetical protein